MSRKARKNVGVIGLGIIGSRVAAGLRATGFQSYVWNRTAKPVPNFLGSPAEVANAAEIIQIFVADSAALFEVIDDMGDALTAKHVFVCCATVGPEAVLEAAKIVEATGAQFLDAPFTGSKLAAEKRELVYYIGGAESAYLKARPVLEATSKSIVRIGAVGHAATVKVVTNMISAVSVQVLAEALSIVQKAGLQPEVLGAAIEHNACRSGVLDLKLPKMIAGDFEPHFSLKHMFKDVQLGIHMANALDIEIPTTTVTAGVMYGAMNKGWADLDFSVLFKNYAAADGVGKMPALPASKPYESGPAPATPEAVSARTPPDQASVITEGFAKFPALAPILTAASFAPAPAPETTAAKLAEAPEAAHKNEEPSPEVVANSESAPSSNEEGKPNPVTETALSNAPSIPRDESVAGVDETNTRSAAGATETSEGTPGSADPDEDGEASGPANNLVRRWFVARSGP